MAAAICRARTLPLSASKTLGDRQALVIGYHRVVDDIETAARTDMPTMLTSREMFERHIDWIGRHFDFVSLDDVGDRIERDVPFSKPVAAVTFDDGYQDVYDIALPMLQRKGIPAAVFVVTDLIGQSSWQIHDRLYHLLDKAYGGWSDPWEGLARVLAEADVSPNAIPELRAASRNPYQAVSTILPALSQADAGRLVELLDVQVGNGTAAVPRTVTWQMVERMHQAGVTIGSHTRTHVWLANESDDKVLDELGGSRRALEARFGAPVRHFAYPGGQFTPRVVDLAARTGYRYGYTACGHHDSMHPELTIERLLLWEGSSIGADGHFSSAILNCSELFALRYSAARAGV
jgi:peptidoglycan/xylan/chitin deacetylase (PgdA/CDA1 family)